MGISNFVNVNDIGITSVRSKKQGELAGLIVERVTIQSDISRLNKIHRELTDMWRSVRVNKTNFDKLTSQQRSKRYNNATKMVNDLKNQRNKVYKLINVRIKKLKKMKNKIENVRKDIRYYST